MAHTLYANFVLESKLNELLKTKLDLLNFLKVDDSLAENAGTTKTINKYTYSGTVEKVAKGASNSAGSKGALTFTPVSYNVVVSQHTVSYQDEDVYRDPLVVDYSVEGCSKVMVNDFISSFFTEAAKATLKTSIASGSTLTYDTVVDAVAKMDLELDDEQGLYLIIPTAMKADIRKDPDFKAVQLGKDSLVISGQIGWVNGIPVAVSKACPTKKAYVGFPEAITLFVKKDTYVEQDRDIETRTNTIVSGKVNVCALTDESKIVEITKA